MSLPKMATMLLAIIFVAMAATGASGNTIVVPEGNRHASQPKVPGASIKRTRDTRSTFDRKYDKILELLQRDRKLRAKISSTAAQYGIDPIHIVGALVGEHTYNVDAYDRLQSYYIKAMAYATGGLSFSYNNMDVDEFVNLPEFDKCRSFSSSFDLWTCREAVWEKSFRSRTVRGVRYPNDRFSAVFFQPFYAGQTFGLGQLNPLTALMHTDMVNRVSGYQKLSHQDGEDVYKAIMNPDTSLAYVAAALRHAIDAYRDIAGLDISGNPGITATLYNVGNPDDRARVLASRNRDRQARGQSPLMPQENYYGWLVNDRIDDLRALF